MIINLVNVSTFIQSVLSLYNFAPIALLRLSYGFTSPIIICTPQNKKKRHKTQEIVLHWLFQFNNCNHWPNINILVHLWPPHTIFPDCIRDNSVFLIKILIGGIHFFNMCPSTFHFNYSFITIQPILFSY